MSASSRVVDALVHESLARALEFASAATEAPEETLPVPSSQTIMIGRMPFKVVFAGSRENSKMIQNEAYCCPLTCTIYIRKGLPPARTRDALVHEICHAFLEATGLRTLLASRVRGDIEAFEEVLVSLAAPRIIEFIDANPKVFVDGRPSLTAL